MGINVVTDLRVLSFVQLRSASFIEHAATIDVNVSVLW